MSPQTLFWFDAAATATKSFTLSIVDTQFDGNTLGISSGTLPPLSTIVLSNLMVSNNFYVVEFETPFAFFDFYGAQAASATQLHFSTNALDGINTSATDPTLFALLHFDFSKPSGANYTAALTSSVFEGNSQVSPVLFSCNKKSDCNIVLDSVQFLQNDVAVSAGFSVLSSSPDSTVDVVNCAFRNNTVFSSDYLFEVSLSLSLSSLSHLSLSLSLSPIFLSILLSTVFLEFLFSSRSSLSLPPLSFSLSLSLCVCVCVLCSGQPRRM
jgi:hypothetical protein